MFWLQWSQLGLVYKGLSYTYWSASHTPVLLLNSSVEIAISIKALHSERDYLCISSVYLSTEATVLKYSYLSYSKKKKSKKVYTLRNLKLLQDDKKPKPPHSEN